jgi:hypothetical protein
LIFKLRLLLYPPPGAAFAPDPAPAKLVLVPYPDDVPNPAPPPTELCPFGVAVELARPDAIACPMLSPDLALAFALTCAEL